MPISFIPEVFSIPIGTGLKVDASGKLVVDLALSELKDATITSIAADNVIRWDAGTGKWVNIAQTELVDGGNF
jgi:hypothetical protein